MKPERLQDIIRKLISLTDDERLFEHIEENVFQPFVVLRSKNLIKVCQSLHEYPTFFFDSLSCISAVDNGVASENRFEVLYHLYSLLNEELFIIKVFAEENNEGVPSIPSLTSIWKTADWHEREAYDLMGIDFVGHPDLRRILLPADWEGHPLRKDYEAQEIYHGIKVKYE
jgi:NADH-quinone oxidoreductase subunit C